MHIMFKPGVLIRSSFGGVRVTRTHTRTYVRTYTESALHTNKKIDEEGVISYEEGVKLTSLQLTLSGHGVVTGSRPRGCYGINAVTLYNL
jgi:hypothetical protein